MNLLCFAHRGEAKAFLEFFDLKHSNDDYFDLYLSDDFALLILGEGIQAATESLSAVLSKYSGKIHEVINFGIAGALDKSLEVEEIYEIRTVYAEKTKNKMEFKSFSAKSEKSLIDIVTAEERVLSNEHSNKLRPFAHIVDRELWAIASVCKRFRKDFKAFKLISDFASDDVNCFDISLKADKYSEKLYAFYVKEFDKKKAYKNFLELIIPDEFYVTLSQKRQLMLLFEKLNQKYSKNSQHYFQSESVQKIISDTKIPKQRTSKLIQFLQNELNPINTLIQNELQALSYELNRTETNISFSNQLEDDSFKLHVNINGPEHFERFKKAVNNFDYEKLIKVLNGEIKE